MLRYFFLSLALVCSTLLVACEQNAQVPQIQKIGVVNINRILVDSEPGRAAAKYMEALQDSLRTQATDLQQKIQKKPEDEAVQKEVQMEYVRLQSKLQAEQQNVNNILNDVVHRVVDTYRKNKGYSIIIFSDVALSFDEAVDVTSGITQAMNAEKVEFKPLAEPKAEQAAPAKESKVEPNKKAEEPAKEAPKEAPKESPKKQ